jgi:tRNA A37 N6-isopentenylltransferase MiaA
MFAAGVHDEVAGAVEGSISGTASKIIGLREVAERPREDAIAAIALRTRQYAAYQRKWMRRIPGIEAVSAVRSPEAVAADILALCRAE